jgi:(p)ppGpp synthase/HD superfamily hydrolase
MEAITLHPKNKTQLSILKKLATEMGMSFETNEVKENSSEMSEAEFYRKIDHSLEQFKEGKVRKIDTLEDFKVLLGI